MVRANSVPLVGTPNFLRLIYRERFAETPTVKSGSAPVTEREKTEIEKGFRSRYIPNFITTFFFEF